MSGRREVRALQHDCGQGTDRKGGLEQFGKDAKRGRVLSAGRGGAAQRGPARTGRRFMRFPAHLEKPDNSDERSQMEKLIVWLDPAKRPVLVQLPEAEYKELEKQWQLPGK